MSRVRAILPAILLLTWLHVPSVEAAITFLDNSSGITANGTSVTAHFWGGSPAAGDLLIAQVANLASQGPPTTPAGWSVAISETNNSPGQVIYYKIADGTEGPDITVSGYGTSTFLSLLTFRYSGVATYNPLDQTSSKSGTGTAISTNSITTTRANELLIAGVCQSSKLQLLRLGQFLYCKKWYSRHRLFLLCGSHCFIFKYLLNFGDCFSKRSLARPHGKLQSRHQDLGRRRQYQQLGRCQQLEPQRRTGFDGCR